MVDRMQIALKLGMDILGIPVSMKHYRQICNAVYHAEQKGVYISPSRVIFSKIRGFAISPMSHEYSGCPSRNLVDDVDEIEMMSEDERKRIRGWRLDEKTKAIRLELKKELKP